MDKLPDIDSPIRLVDRAKGIIEGWAIPYRGPIQGRDFYGTAFTEETNLHEEWFPNGRPLLYDHGFDLAIGTEPVGRQIRATREELGVWAQVQLNRAHEYAEVIADLAEQGVMGFSSGSLGHLVDIDSKGLIREWPWIELSMTPTPANPYAMIRPTQTADMLNAYRNLGLPVSAEAEEALTKFKIAVPDLRALRSAKDEPEPAADPEPEADPAPEPEAEPTSDDDLDPVRGVALGRLIRRLRDDQGISNDELANAAGLSVVTMRQVIAGRIVCPPMTRLEAMAKALKVKADRLIGAAEADGCSRYDDDEGRSAGDLLERVARLEAGLMKSETPPPSDGTEPSEDVVRALLEADEHLKGLVR